MANLENTYQVAKAIYNKMNGGSGTAYTAGANIQISDENVISATDTTYSAGSNMSISGTTISAKGYTVDFDNNVTIGEDLTVDGDTYLSPVVYWNNKVIPTPPSSDGTYMLEAWVQSGVLTYHWIPKGE